MAIQVSPLVNNMLFVLIGERLMQANEDLARDSHAAFRSLAHDVRGLSDVIERTVSGTARALPPQVGNDYVRAMGMFVDSGGTGYLKQFAGQLDDIADGRVKTSYDIMEGKWQISAEVIRLLIELKTLFWLSAVTGGATAGRAVVAQQRSRVAVLLILHQLLSKTHLLPVLSEAFEEAFQSFAVRLGMIAFTSGEQSFNGFDWGQIGQDAVFGGLAGGFFGGIVGGNEKFLSLFRDDVRRGAFAKSVADDVTVKVGAEPGTGHVDRGSGVARQPNASSVFLASGGSEALAEILGSGFFNGNWTTSWDTFLGAGVSGNVGEGLNKGAEKTGLAINLAFSNRLSSEVSSWPAGAQNAGVNTVGTDEGDGRGGGVAVGGGEPAAGGTGATGSEAAGVAGTAGTAGVTGAAAAGAGVVSGRTPTVSGADAGVSDAGVARDQGAVGSAGVPSAGSLGSAESGGGRPRPAGEVGTGSAAGGVTEVAAQALPAVGSSGTGVSAVAGRPAEVAAVGEGRAPAAEVTAGLEPAEPVQVVAGAVSGGAGSAAMGASTAAVQAAGPVADPGRVANQPVSSAGRPSTVSEPAGDTGRARIGERSEQAGVRPSGQVNPSARSGAGDGSGDVVAADVVQQAETDERTVPEAEDAARRPGPGVLSLGDGRVEDSSTQAGGAGTVLSAGPGVLSGGSSGPGRLLGSGEVRTDRFVPGSGEAFVVEAGEGGLPGRVLPGGSGGSGEWTEVGFLWEWYAGDRPGQETVRLTRRIFLDGQGVDPVRVEVMRRNAVAGVAELNAQGVRLPAVRPGGLVDGSDPSGPRLELVVEFVDSVADAHDVVQVRDGRPQAPGEMVQNVWYTQASPVLLAHEIAHGYGPRDAQAHDDGVRDGGRALLTSPRDEEGRPLGVPLTSHDDEAQQAGEGRWDLMGPIDLGEPGRSYGLTPHELGQIADILSPFLHRGVSAPKPRVVQETAYARPAAPVHSDEGLGFEDGLGFDVDVESGGFGGFGVFPGDDGEAVGSRVWAVGSVDEDADVFALAEEYSGSAVRLGDGVEASRTESAESGLVAGGGKRLGGSESSVDEDDTDRSAQYGSKRRRIEGEAGTGGGEGVRDEGADSDQEALNTASAGLTELLGSDFGSQSVSAGGPADVDMEGSEEFAGSAGSVGLSSAVGGDASGAVGASDPGGAGSDARRELEEAVDDLTSKLGSLDALLQKIGAAPKDKEAIREEEWHLVSPEVMDAIYEKREKYRDAPRFAVRAQVARQQVIWLQKERSKGSSYIANKVGVTRNQVEHFRYGHHVLPLAALMRIAGLYAAEGGAELQVQQPDSQRELEDVVDDLTSKLGSLDALFEEIGADSGDDKKAIQDEEWHLVSPEVMDAIHRLRETYRDAPRFAVRAQVARQQVIWLQWKKKGFSYVANKVGATRNQVRHFRYGDQVLPLATLMRIADLYAAEGGPELQVQRLHSQRSSSEEIPAELSEFLDGVRLDELEDPPAAGSVDTVTTALLGSGFGSQSVSADGPADVDMEGSGEFAGSAGSVGLSSAVGGDASGAVGASDPGGAGSDARRELGEAVDDLTSKLGSLDALFKEIGAGPKDKKAIREKKWQLVSLQVVDAIHEKRREYRDAPRFAVAVQVARQQVIWLQWEKKGFSYIANKVGATRNQVRNFRYGRQVLSLATLMRIADLYAAEGGPELQVQQPDSQRSSPGGADSDARRLEEAVDDLKSKLGSSRALFKEIGAGPKDKEAIREKKWQLVSLQVVDAIHEKRREYRDAPRFAVAVQVARQQMVWLQRERGFSYVAKKVGLTRNQVRNFRHGDQLLSLATLMRIAGLYAAERERELQVQRLHSQRSSSEEVSAGLSLDESEDPPAAGSADRVTAALLGFEDGLGFDVDVESAGFGDFGVFPGDDGEAVESQVGAVGAVDEDADVFALAEEYSGPAVPPGAQGDASAADGVDDGVEASRASRTESAESGLVAGGGKRHSGSESSVDEDDTDRSAQRGSKRRRIEWLYGLGAADAVDDVLGGLGGIDLSSAWGMVPGAESEVSFPGAVETGRARIEPVPLDREDAPQWVGEPYGGCLWIRHFEARRYLLPSGEFVSVAVVRLFLDQEPGQQIPGEALTELGQRAQQGVDERWNTGHRLPNGDLFRVELEFVNERDSVHHVVTVHSGNPRADHMNWGTDTGPEVLAHEVGHLLGLEDEYREGDRNRQRAVYEDEGLMGPFARDGRGRPAVDNDHLAVVDSGRMRIAPRYLRQLGAWIEGALKTARLQTAHGVAFSTEDTLYPRADGLPTRAHFALDVRRSVLYGEARTGGGGRITPAPASDRPRPVALEGTDRPNGTYRATYPDLHRRPVRENLTDLIAGGLLLPAHPDPGPDPGLMMFPAHWTEEDAVYAAEQAYLHALRNGTVQAVPGRYGVHTWRGEYAGVWIEGEVRQGVFTGFRPSDDQADTLPPPHAAPPALAADNHGGPVFGRHVEDLVRYGDRRTRTGAHHEPGLTPADQMRFHGLQINRGQEHHNKTYDAQVFFLHPGLRVGESRPFLPRAWEQHVDGDKHVMFPREWKPDTLLDNVEKAHGSALDAGTVRQVDDRGTYHWVGTAAGVRIEGLVRDGRHLVFRPTYVQAHVSWPESRPVGEVRVPSVTVASDDGRVLPFDIRHLLFANGQRAVELTVRIHLAPAPGTDLAWMDETFDKVRQAMRGAFMRTANVSPMNGALVGLTLLRTDDVEQAHHTLLVVGRDERLMIGGIVGFVPNGAELRTFVEQLVYGWAPPADAWRLPADADQDDGSWALSHAVERLAFADPFGRPTTLREPDPSARGDWPSNVPSDAPSAPPADFGDLDEMEIFILSLDGFALAEEYSGPAVPLGARDDVSVAGGVDDGVEASRTSQTVLSAGPGVLSGGLSGPGRLLGSGEVRTDRFVPGSGEAFVVEAGEGGLPGRVLPGGSGGSGERTEVGFVWEWYAGDRPGQETVRLTRRIFLDGRGVDPVRVEVMRRNAVAGVAELNAQGVRLPAVRPGGLVDGSDPLGPRLELVVEFVDSVADAHDVVQVRDGRPQAPGEMVQNVWYTQASPVLLAHEIAHGYGPRDAQARDGGRALLTSPRDERGRPLGVPLTSHDDEAQQAGEGRWDLMGPIDLGEPGRSYGLTPHELGQIADILSPFLHRGVSAPKPRVVQETAYARPAAPVRSDEGLGFDVDVESGGFGDFGVFPGDDGEAVGSRAWAVGSVDEDAEVFALAEEYSGPAGVDDVDEGADSVPEDLNTASASFTELLPDFGSQSVSAGEPADVDMEGSEEFAGSAGSVGLSSADDGVEASRTSRTESAESGLVAGGGKRLGGSESSVDEDDTDRSAQYGSKRRRVEVEAGTSGGEGVRDEGADSDQEDLNTASAAITELFGSDFGSQSVSAGGPADVDMEGSGEFAGSAGSVGLSSAVGGDASGAVGASDPGGAGSDARRELEEAVDGLRIKLGSLDALFRKIGADPDDEKAIRNEEWHSVSPEVMDAIYEQREKYRDAPRFAVRAQVARQQVAWLQKERDKTLSDIANEVGVTKYQVHNFRNGNRILSVAVLKRIAGLYAAEGGPELQVQQLDSQRSLPGGAGSDARRELEEVVDGLRSKLGSLGALLREIGAESDDEKAIRNEEWRSVSLQVMDAIHEQREKYRDAPRFAVGVKAARQQVAWLQQEKNKTLSDIANEVGATADQVGHFRQGKYFLRAAVLMKIAGLYAREGGPDLQVQRLHSQRSSSEEVPAGLSEVLDEVEDPPAAESVDRVTAALLGSDLGPQPVSTGEPAEVGGDEWAEVAALLGSESDPRPVSPDEDSGVLSEEYSGPAAVHLRAQDDASAADGVDDSVEALRTSQTVPSAAPSMLSGGSSGPGRLLGSGEVRTDRWIPWRRDGERPVEPFEFAVAPDGRRRVQRPDGQRGFSGERTEVGFLWEWYAGDRPGQETVRLTRRIFLDGRGVDAGRVEVMRRNAVAGVAELNAQGGRLPAARPGGLVDGSDPSGPRLELVVEFVDSEADAHDVVQVRDGRPQAPGDMVQNVWYTQASPVLLAHEIAHGYGPGDAQAHDGEARDGGRALLASPRDERGRPLGVPLTSHDDEARQAGEGRWDLMGPIDVGEPGRSYGLTPHELGQIADILSPFLHRGVSAPKPRMAAEALSPDAAPAVNMSMVEERDRRFVRQSHPGEILFRFDDRPPEEIYKVGGFHPRAPENLTQIWDWAKYTNSPSQFVSTTRKPELWFKGKRYRYEIHTSLMEDPCGIDINVTITLQKVGGRLPRDWRNYYPREEEIAFTGSIPAEAVVSFYDGHEKRRGTWNPESGEVEWSADGEEQQGAVLPSPDQLGQPGGGSEPTGVPHVTESAPPPASVDSVPAGAGGSEASSDPSESSDTSSADGSDGNEMASPDATPALSHEQADGPMVTAGNPAGLDPEPGDAGVNPDDDESSAMADLQSTTATAVAQDEDDGAWTGRPAPGRPELGENVALAAGLSADGEDSSRRAGGAGVSSVGPGVLPGDSSGLGELLGSGEVRTDRWLPYGVNPGRSDEERSEGNRRRDGERPVEPFEFIVAPDGRRRVQRPDGRRGHSGERTEVGYGWEWYAGDRPGQETIRLTRRLFLEDQDADPARVAAMRLRLAAFMEQVNREGNRLNVFQPDQVTGPQLPGPRVQFAVEFVGSKDRAHQEVQVRDGLPGGDRDMVQNRWYTDVHPAAHFHEVFHGYGPRDDDASEKVLLTPGGRSTQVLSAGESSLMGKFENLQSRIVITSDHLQQIADILTPYLPYGGRALTDRVPADGAAGGEADAVVVRPTAEPATESVALSDGASPGETQEAPVSGDTAPAVDYRMVHKPEMAPSGSGLDHEPTEPGDDSASVPDAGRQEIVFARIETALEVHRPPRIDHSMPSPSLEGGPVRFDDDSRLPGYLTGDGADDTEGRSYGHSQVTLRGADLALQEISEIVSTHLGGEASTVPGLSEVLADLSQAMRTAPQTFHGDGYQSSAFGNSPIRVLRVVTRPYGNWERFTDLHGEPVKMEVAQRSQVTAGAVQSVGAGRRAARGVSVLPAPGAAAFARLGVTAGSTRTAEYGMQDETVSQVETRTAETSHLHLDDVAYEVSLSDAPETVSSGGRPAGSSATGETFTFAVRNGLAVRLADSETLAADPGRVPDRMELDERSDYRLVHTEGYGPVRGLAEQLVGGFGAVPGSAAYEYITGLFTSENFHRAADRLAKGNVPSDPLFAEDGSPLGAFVVEKVVPGEAELLTESRAAEMRHTIQQTATNERTLSTTSSRGVNLTLGPSFDLGPLGSLMAGPSVGYDRSSTHSSTFGGSGGRKIVGRAKNVPTVLYKVQKTVHVRRTGGEVITFDTWSLDRMTHTEARRLAGWDDGTTLRKREPANEPYAPAYLTKDRPAVLGMSRPEAFIHDSDLVNDEDQQKGWLHAFTDRVIGSAAKTYPDLLAPLEDFGDPNHSRWRDREHYNLALRNTLRVMNALSHHRMAGSLEELMTGLVIELDVAPGMFMRPRLSIRIRGVLTGRRYEGTQNDLILRHSTPGTERLDGSQSTTHTRELGTDVSLWGFADTVNVSGGYNRRGQNGRGTQYGATASQEQLAISSLPSHLHSYRLELTAEIGGFWRYRSGPRALTLGWLGRQEYLQDEGSTDLVGGSADEFVGRVVLAVPDEYTPATDPDVAEGTVAVEAVELDPAHTQALATRDTAVLSEGHGPDVFGDQPHQTLGVGADERLTDVAVDLMRTVSGASWHFSRPGALPHDAIVRFVQPQLLTGGFDQRSGPLGSRISVIAKGHWRDRVGELVHRMRILNLRVASGPIKLGTEMSVSSDLRMAESATAATSSGWTMSGGGTTGGTELSTVAGVQYRRGSSRTEITKVTRTVTSDINRDDSGYKILLSGDVQHDIVASVRPEGILGPYRNRSDGKQLTFPSSYLGQVSEKAAHQLGILKDGLGDVPRYVSHQWAQTTWWHDHPFGSYPVNSLDTTKVLAAFDEQLRRWNVDEADRERVHSLVTPRAVRALREQMTSTGAAARTRVGRWRTPFLRIGSRAGSLRVELIAGESEFVGLDHGVVMEDTRIATVTRTDGGSSARSRGIGPTVMQQVATAAPGSEPGLGGLESLRPQFGVQTTSSDLTSHGRSRARTKRHVFYAREPHADYRTPYTLRLTLDLGTDEPTLTAEGPVGTLREQVPLSLSVARIGQADDVLGPPSLDDPSGSVVLWPRDGAVLRHIAAWRSARQPHGAQGPIRLPSSGFHVRRIVGLETLREAGVLAIATAYGSFVAPAGSPLTLTGEDLADALGEARSTGLTRPGTDSALALDNATGDAALAAFFEDSATATGYEVPGLNEGGSAGDYRLYSGPDFTRATLLAVIPVSTMESAERHSAGRVGTQEHASGFEYSLGGRAAFAADDAGSVAPSASMAGPSTAEAGGQAVAGQESAQLNTKVAGRSFVFAIPTDWLGVAEVTRSSPFGPIKSRPQAVETQGTIIALVHEDVAREWGLINDGNFPSRVADAWTQVVKAGQAWTDADSTYWEQRRALADLQGEERKRKRASMKDLPQRARAQATMNHLLQQADAAAEEFHRVRAAADRLTRWHQLPAEAHQAGEPELRAGLTEPPPVVFQPVPVAETDSADAERYTVRESTPDGPGRLISPGGDHYTVHDVPTDGDAFFHALAEAVHHAAPDRLTARVDVADRQKIIDGLRRLLADELSNPGARGLLKFTSPDTKDTFSDAELAASGVAFREGSPERREYEDSGRIPLHAELPAEQRRRLASTQLLRSGDTEGDAGWNHGAADLQPSLAARVFGARITVVRADGAFQDFRPLDTVGEGADEELVHRVPDEELVHMVLLSKDGHYLPALPSGDPRREPPLPAPAERDTIAGALETETPGGQGLRPAYSTPPWERGATSTWRAVVTHGKPATLVDPGGTVHELKEPTGDGNGFWSGIADALELAGATASAAEVRQQSIPTSLRLDRERPFTDEELVRAGLSENGILSARLRRADGRIPADFELTRSQEEALIRQQVFTPRRWDDATERNAAELAAARGLTLTVVAEDGTSRTHAPSDGTSGPRVILWRRGRDYLRAERPMPDPKLVDLLNEPAFAETRVRREHLEAIGLSFSPEETTMWLLAPEIMVREFRLSVENREALLRAHPDDLFPASVRDAYKRLGPGGNA